MGRTMSYVDVLPIVAKRHPSAWGDALTEIGVTVSPANAVRRLNDYMALCVGNRAPRVVGEMTPETKAALLRALSEDIINEVLS